jgi:hypothetical protein
MSYKPANTGPNTAGPGPTPAPSDELSGRHSNANYGENQARPDGRKQCGSSLNPGQKHTNDYLNPSDAVRDQIINQGLRSDDAAPINTQLRDIGKGNVPDAVGMASARARQPSNPDSVGERGIPSVLTQAKNSGTGQP